MISDELAKSLDTGYLLLKQKDFMDAARLYVSRKQVPGNYFMLGGHDFGEVSIIPEDKAIAIWSDAIHSKSIHLEAGQYTVSIIARGDQGKKVFPHLNIYINQQKVAEFFVTDKFETRSFSFIIQWQLMP